MPAPRDGKSGSPSADDDKKHADSLKSIRRFTAISDRNGRLQFASAEPITALGYNEDDILRRPFWEASWFSPSKESQRTIKDGVQDALKGEKAECRVQAFAKDGTPIPVTNQWYEPQGKPWTHYAASGGECTPGGNSTSPRSKAPRGASWPS